jgi:hypothetical protein
MYQNTGRQHVSTLLFYSKRLVQLVQPAFFPVQSGGVLPRSKSFLGPSYTIVRSLVAIHAELRQAREHESADRHTYKQTTYIVTNKRVLFTMELYYTHSSIHNSQLQSATAVEL